MAGSGVAGALSMAFDVTLRAPHGGIFVFFAVDHVLGFFISIAAGMIVACALVVLLKSRTEDQSEIAELSEVAVV